MKVYWASLVVVAALAAFGTVMAGGPVILVAVGVLGLLAGAYLGLAHPTWLLWSLATVLGFLPAGYFPGVHLPLVFSFTMGVLLATVVHKREVISLSTMEKLMLALVGVSFASLLITLTSITDVAEYIKWSAGSLLVIALLRLPRPQLARFGQVYVGATTVAAVLAIVILVVDSGGRIMRAFSIFGYGVTDPATFAVYSGGTTTVRLSGTFLEPNSAAVNLLVALLMCLILFRGRWRAVMAAILFVAVVLTLSRSGIFALLVAVVLLLIFGAMPARRRGWILAAVAAAFAAAFAVPQVRSRVLSSFGSNDTGSSARLDALKDFPQQVAGRWLFGRGWGLPEFKNGDLAFTTNFVANAPLLSVYRGGIVGALFFVVVLLYGCYLGYRCLRSGRWDVAVYGGGFIGFVFVTMQLDIGTVIIPVTIVAFSLLIVFLVYAAESVGVIDPPTTTESPRSGAGDVGPITGPPLAYAASGTSIAPATSEPGVRARPASAGSVVAT